MNKYSPGGECVCCSVDCIVYADTFEGSDTTTLSNWYEAVGDWEIVSNRLVPEASVADQRILANAGVLDTYGAYVVGSSVSVTVRGSDGAIAGVALFFDSAGFLATPSTAYTDGNWIEATVQFGSGTSGRLNLNVYESSVLTETWNADLECNANEYDIPPDEDVTLELCQSTVLRAPADPIVEATGIVARLTVGSNVYEIGIPTGFFFDGAPFAHFAACITGNDCTGVSFDNFSFTRRSSAMPNDECELCLACGWVEWINESLVTPPPLANFTQVAGTWVQATGCSTYVDAVETADTAALLIHDDRWANDNLLMKVVMCYDGVETTGRLIFSYVDDDNYWCVEASLTEFVVDIASELELNLIHRATGVETVEYTFGPRVVGISAGVVWFVAIYDCIIYFGFPGVFVAATCFEDAALNDTGKFGVGTGGTVDDATRFSVLDVTCTSEFDCEAPPDVTQPDPPDDPDPGDPTGCCSDLDELLIGDTIECTIAGITYFLIAPCAGACGDAAFLTALNATHNLTCIYKSNVFMWFYGDTGLINTGTLGPCDPYTPVDELETMKLWVKVTKVAADTCVWQGMLTPSKTGSCLFFFTGNPDVTPIPATCSGWVLDRDTGQEPGEPKLCCLQGDSATLTLNIP